VKSRLQIILCILLAAALFLILGKNDMEFSRVWKNRLASVPDGVFVMGSREGNADAQPHEARVGGFRIGRCEVTVAEFVEYLNGSGSTHWPGSPQITRRFGGYSARWFQSRKPVAFVSMGDAADYCRWLSEKTGERVRLPTEAEWEYAARGGIRRARYPWGWGSPEGRACYNADVTRRVASFKANPFGLFDMAGNVFEWCGPAVGEQAPARGGSWSERDPNFLRVFHRVLFPREYRDADVGFRVVVEGKESP
jgi:formylglycine-generating enzyme required for sulfatase activity